MVGMQVEEKEVAKKGRMQIKINWIKILKIK
jgi:hypothetical protein